MYSAECHFWRICDFTLWRYNDVDLLSTYSQSRRPSYVIRHRRYYYDSVLHAVRKSGVLLHVNQHLKVYRIVIKMVKIQQIWQNYKSYYKNTNQIYAALFTIHCQSLNLCFKPTSWLSYLLRFLWQSQAGGLKILSILYLSMLGYCQSRGQMNILQHLLIRQDSPI